MKFVKHLSLAAALFAGGFVQTASAQNLIESLFKSAAEAAAKAALEKAAGGAFAPAAAPPAAAVAPMQPMPAQMQAMQPMPGAQAMQPAAPAIADPGCKRGQLINPYFVMLQANLLPDASLADMACVSSTQLAGLNTKYSKVGLK